MAGSGYRDYFKVLGVDRGADADTVKRAFRKLARQYHPDVNPGDSAAEARFKEISEAYEVLSDPDKRRRYEQFGRYWSQAGGSPGGVDVDFGRYGSFDDFINDLLGRFGGPPPGGGFGFGSGFPGGFQAGGVSGRGTSVGLDAEATLTLGLADAFRGCERTLSVNDERVQVRIPAGVQDGSRLRLKGKGNIQPSRDRRGDLYLTIRLEPHPIWRVADGKLRGELPVTVDELVLGGEVSMATPDGPATITVPAGTRPGATLRVKGKGWPASQGRGDLLLTLRLELPRNVSERERQLLRQLQEARQVDPRRDWLRRAVL
jgi:curved DNA-binding protein